MIVDRCRDEREFKEFYKKYANERIANVDWLLNNEKYVFCYYDEKDNYKLLGCIYLEGDKESRVCLSGFSQPKQMDRVITAIKWVSDFMDKDVLYSHTNRRNAKLVLLKSGFEKINDELFIRRLKNG